MNQNVVSVEDTVLRLAPEWSFKRNPQVSAISNFNLSSFTQLSNKSDFAHTVEKLPAPVIKSMKAIGATAVKVVWTPVAEAYSFKFVLKATGKPTKTYVLPPMPPMAVLDGLEENTDYTYTVETMSIEGPGVASQPVPISTPKGSTLNMKYPVLLVHKYITAINH